MPRQESVELWRTTHDEWCAHDEADDGIECDCHLSVIAALRKRLEAAEKWALSNGVVCDRCGHLAVAHGGLGCVRCDATPECRLSEHAVRVLGLRAALAGKE